MTGAEPRSSAQQGSRLTLLIVGGAVAALVIAGVLVATLSTGNSSTPQRAAGHHTGTSGAAPSVPGATGPAPAPTVGSHQTASAPAPGPDTVPAAFLIATLSHDVPRYSAPGGQPVGTVASTWYGNPSALPVIAQRDGYLEVRLQERPNGSVAWISSSGVTLSSSPYCIVIHLSTRRLELYDAGRRVLDAPAGIGTYRYPTPTGNFFLGFFALPPSPGYAPFVIVTSGHSNAISDYERSGDALVAIHGPLGAGAVIGTTGARVSHGCVRLHVPDLEQLHRVPPGSPIDIVA
jgi:lipoprotein-anchoring transpeptidase ErfK/SrfK